MGRRAAIAGASGLVGTQLLKMLLEAGEVDAVVSLGRRKLASSESKLTQAVVDFAAPDSLRAALEQSKADELFCCLGTTIKKAGSQAAFRAVDQEAPLAFAKAGLAAGAQQFTIVTSVGADAKSSIFYSRVKGELEQSLRALGFSRGVKVVQPSMILGDREERRLAERTAQLAMKAIRAIFAGPLWKYRPIEADRVARAMFNAALREAPGDRVYEGKPLFRLAGFA